MDPDPTGNTALNKNLHTLGMKRFFLQIQFSRTAYFLI
jgi:hypothetical protein